MLARVCACAGGWVRFRRVEDARRVVGEDARRAGVGPGRAGRVDLAEGGGRGDEVFVFERAAGRKYVVLELGQGSGARAAAAEPPLIMWPLHITRNNAVTKSHAVTRTHVISLTFNDIHRTGSQYRHDS